METLQSELRGVRLMRLDIFEDHRGQYIESYNKGRYYSNGMDIEFVQDDISVSSKNVLKGIHGDFETWKLITCFYGKFYLVVVDCRQDLDSFGRWESFVLSGENGLQVLVPPGYGNGHLILSDQAVFHYKQSTYYHPKKQFSYRYDDARFNIWWPSVTPILSRRDEAGKYV